MPLNNCDDTWLTSYRENYEQTVVNYVLGEVCIVARADAADVAGDVYNRTRRNLNEWIHRAIAANHWTEYHKKTARQVKQWVLGKAKPLPAHLPPGGRPGSWPDVPSIGASST